MIPVVYPEGVFSFLAIVMLLFAAVEDVRRRKVANHIWWPFLIAGIVGGFLLLGEYGFWSREAASLGLSALSCVVFYVLWRLRLFGGADAKALMVLAFLVPLNPSPWGTVFAVDSLTNALLLSVPVGLLLLAGNAAKRQENRTKPFEGCLRPTIPFMVPLMLGAALSLGFGNLAFRALAWGLA